MQPPLRVLRRARRPNCPCSTRSEGRPDDGEDQRREGRTARQGDVPPDEGHRRRATTAPTTRSSSAAGHNGLTNAAYLAKAGLRTLVLERRHLVGGAAITEELRPGFWFTTFSYALSLLRPDIIHELELVKHGFMPILMPTTFCPKEDGDYLLPRPGPRREPPGDRAPLAGTTPTRTRRSTTTSARSCQAIKPLLDDGRRRTSSATTRRS